MLLSLKANNCLIFDAEIEFSMRADMHYKRFPNNVASYGNTNVLKSAILIGPNNSGKTNFVRLIRLVKQVILNSSALKDNPSQIESLFADDPIAKLCVSFLHNGAEFEFEVKYDVLNKEYVYERFTQFTKDKHGNIRSADRLIRDNQHVIYSAEDDGLGDIMKVASKSSILIHLVDTESFPGLHTIKQTLTEFASKIDVVDMNNIPIKKTIDMLKQPDATRRKIANFVLNADLYLDDFRYLNEDEVEIVLTKNDEANTQPQENALAAAAPLAEMLHLASVYKGIIVPSMLFDSTGTKKIAALASYVIGALESGRILVVDELDNSLHFRLTRAVIALFNNELNKSAQLIATVHDVSLMDCRKLFRKEQIWFTHKDRNGVYLYSLAEFTAKKDGVRDTSDLAEKYRKGVFGALPEPDLFRSLLEAVHDE